jgi:predicted dehydrogenase
MNENTTKKKLGVALVGLGTYSSGELGPALKQTTHCYLAGVVSGDPGKRNKWREEYNLSDKNLYSYEAFDGIKDNSDIDIVYVVLPNDMHAEFVIRAAKAGKHVICEKPMDVSVEQCRRMIEACEDAGVKLSIGYRLHFDPYNQEMMRLGQHAVLGSVKKVIAKNGMDVGQKDQWRLKYEKAGGGPLMDLGIYCVQGVVYTLGELPVSVNARFDTKTDPDKFSEVEEGISWEMEFPNGVIAYCETSYTKEYNVLRAETDKGWFELQPAFEYRGLKGRTSQGILHFPEINQQARQMDDFAQCIMENKSSRVPGEMGLRDVEILMAVYESARTGRKVELHLEPFEKLVEM